MFKLQSTFVTLALVGAVLSSPLPVPRKGLTSSGELNARTLPLVGNLLGGLLGGGGSDSDSGDDSGSSGGGLLGGILRRDEELNSSEDALPLVGNLLGGIIGGGKGDDSDDSDNSGSSGGGLLGGILKRQDEMTLDDIFKDLDGLAAGLASRQDEEEDDDNDTDDNEYNERRAEALNLPLLGSTGGLLASLGLGGLGKTLKNLVTALGGIVGSLL